ncbi:MAG TPA: GNAT family N-acetyltransferase [Ktedonobacterales bacterium]|nr:GNAT family N-acetyltransferase [Ktedonobacterales bacterium]
MRIDELTTEAEWREAFPVMRELRPHLDEATFLTLMRKIQHEGYRLLAARDGQGTIRALAGIAEMTNLYFGHHICVHELITTASERSRGHGKALMDHVEALARDLGCDTVALISGLQRADAHRFYEQKIGMMRTAYNFQKAMRPSIFTWPLVPQPAPPQG